MSVSATITARIPRLPGIAHGSGRRVVRTLVALSLAALLAGCNPFPETWEWNQKLTVEVSTPDGLKTGSSVTNVRWQEVNSSGNYPSGYTGEATVVDLGPRGFLFALIGEETKYIALRTFSKDLGENYSITEKGFAAMARLRGTREVPQGHYPLLVTFADISDPTTVKRVDPDNLAASFGPGVSLKRITLEITDEPATQGKVENVVEWLADPSVMQNSGWKALPLESRSAIGRLVTKLPDPKASE